jgi:hypothetical protein
VLVSLVAVVAAGLGGCGGATSRTPHTAGPHANTANRALHAESEGERQARRFAAGEQEVTAFERSKTRETKLVLEARSGLRETVYLQRRGGRVCVGVSTKVAAAGGEMGPGKSICGSERSQDGVLLVTEGRGGEAILDVAGYSGCNRPVGLLGLEVQAEREACTVKPFRFRLLAIRGTSGKSVQSNQEHGLELSRFRCRGGEVACIFAVLPNGAPGRLLL